MVHQGLKWLHFKLATVEEYGDAVMDEGAEASRPRFHELYLRVEAFGHGVGDVVSAVRE